MSRVGKAHEHPSEVYCVRSCSVDAGADLLAIGGALFLEILRQVRQHFNINRKLVR